MHLDRLLTYFATSPAVRLLRAELAPFVVAFLDRQFKQSGRNAVPHSELLAALIAYIEELRELYPDAPVGGADGYLRQWCSPEVRWLERFVAGRDEPVYQLTPHTEEVLLFLDRVLDRDLGFVGTECHLKMVIDTLADLVIGSSDDPQQRLNHLRERRDRMQAEIDQIETDGRIARYQPAQIRERFSTAVALLRQLQGDFRAVEESFRDITAQVQKKQFGGDESRGGILEFALDAEDQLKAADQGVSFYEFVRLILSPSQTERLETIIREVRQIPELASQHEGLATVRGMVTSLQSEAEQVMRTNQRLSATLRRLLDGRAHAERRRVATLLREIQGMAVDYAGSPNDREIGLSLQVRAELNSPFRRGFWSDAARFETVDLTGFEPEAGERLEAFRQLAALKRLDWAGMRDNISHLLMTAETPTLGDLLEVHPAESGVVELIGYVQIAAEDGHRIESGSSETITVCDEAAPGRLLRVTLPRVTFLPGGSESVD